MKPLFSIIPILFFLFSGCTTPASLMRHTEDVGTVEESDAVRTLASFAEDKNNDSGLRCWALRALSKCNDIPPDAVKQTGKLLTDTSEHDTVRTWAAVVLSSWSSEDTLPWFISALRGSLSPDTGYYVLEGIARSQSHIRDDPETNRAVLSALNRYESRLTTVPSSLFLYVRDLVSTLPVLTAVLENTISRTASPGNGTDYRELYTNVHRLFEHVLASHDAYITAFHGYKTVLSTAFDLSFSSCGTGYSPLRLLTIWHTGKLCRNRDFSLLAVDHLSLFSRSDNGPERILTTWALLRMSESNAAARHILVNTILSEEKDPAVLSLFDHYQHLPGNPDTLFLLLREKNR